MKKQLVKESLVATLITLLLTFAVSKIPYASQYMVLISQGISDMDMFDLYYTGRDKNNNTRDEDIVLVEIAAGRADIAEQINIINEQQPAVIGLDAIFLEPKDSGEDRELLQAIHGVKNIVLTNRLKELDNGQFIMEKNFFEAGQDKQYNSGFINFIGEENAAMRYYKPFVELNDQQYNSFSSSIAQLYAADRFERLRRRGNDMEIINYWGNLSNYNSLSVDELTYYESTGQLSEVLKNKIVLLGYFVKQPPLVLEDLHFSPLNESPGGKSLPDMYGVVIHANILSMVLSGKYATLAPQIVAYLFAAITTFFFVIFVLKRELKPGKYDEIKEIFLQIAAIIIVCYLLLQIYNWFLVKISPMPFILSTIVCVEFFGIYKGLALWLNKKWQYKTILKDE